MTPAKPRRLFVAGSTGATGQVLTAMAGRLGVDHVAHQRPKPGRVGAFELTDAAALDASMQGCTTVLQLIGTMRKRFGQGDTYETSDIGTTQLLVDAAKRCGVDHFILLGSAGTGRPIGAYLKAKARVEALVRDSGIAFSIFRPSALEGGDRKPIPGLRAITSALGLQSVRPIRLEELSAAMLHCAAHREPLDAVLEGSSLWALVAAARP